MVQQQSIHWRYFPPLAVQVEGPGRAPDGERWWTATCEALPGLSAMADTPDRARRALLRDAPSFCRLLEQHEVLPSGLVVHAATTAVVGWPVPTTAPAAP